MTQKVYYDPAGPPSSQGRGPHVLQSVDIHEQSRDPSDTKAPCTPGWKAVLDGASGAAHRRPPAQLQPSEAGGCWSAHLRPRRLGHNRSPDDALQTEMLKRCGSCLLHTCEPATASDPRGWGVQPRCRCGPMSAETRVLLSCGHGVLPSAGRRGRTQASSLTGSEMLAKSTTCTRSTSRTPWSRSMSPTSAGTKGCPGR